MTMPTIDAVLERLSAGNQRFVADKMTGLGRDQQRRHELVNGQQPWAIVLTCADSRVAPEIAFDTGLGELFEVRVAGNIANKSSIASIEYAVAHIGTPVIIVLGHQSCGAVGAALAGGDNGPNLNHLLAHLAPVLERAAGASPDDVAKLNAQHVASQLVSNSAIIKSAVEAGRLRIVPAFYYLEDGAVSLG